MKNLISKNGELATDFMEALIKHARDPAYDVRKVEKCEYHVHTVTAPCDLDRTQVPQDTMVAERLAGQLDGPSEHTDSQLDGPIDSTSVNQPSRVSPPQSSTPANRSRASLPRTSTPTAVASTSTTNLNPALSRRKSQILGPGPEPRTVLVEIYPSPASSVDEGTPPPRPEPSAYLKNLGIMSFEPSVTVWCACGDGPQHTSEALRVRRWGCPSCGDLKRKARETEHVLLQEGWEGEAQGDGSCDAKSPEEGRDPRWSGVQDALEEGKEDCWGLGRRLRGWKRRYIAGKEDLE